MGSGFGVGDVVFWVLVVVLMFRLVTRAPPRTFWAKIYGKRRSQLGCRALSFGCGA